MESFVLPAGLALVRRRRHGPNANASHVLAAIAIAAPKRPALVRASSYASDNSFCGESWSDASSHCDDRQPCSYGTDRECSVPGHVCFADTTCSVKAGHGEKFKYEKLVAAAGTDYADVTNTMFCGDWWGGAEENCSVRSHCTDFLEGCFAVQENCFETPCHIHDIAEAELGRNWKLVVTGKDDGTGGGVEIGKLDPDDKRRSNFCGVNWAQASTNCNQWCAGTNGPGECPGGERCFADTLCYFDDDLQPTPAPIVTLDPTQSPLLYVSDGHSECGIVVCVNLATFLDPFAYCFVSIGMIGLAEKSDPTNESFCGSSWALATQNCSPKTHCKDDSDCRRQGHKCWQHVPGCHLADMLDVDKPVNGAPLPQSPAKEESPEDLFLKNDPKNFRFCGLDYDDAKENCYLGRHCPDLRCSEPGLRCFIDLQYVGGEHCNAYDMIRGHTRQPTDKPTSPPTPEPTFSPSTPPTTSNPTTLPPTKPPTDRPTKFPLSQAPVPVVKGLCAESFKQLQQNFRTAQECSNISPCEFGQLCFPNVDVASFATGPPSAAPTISPNTKSPTSGEPSSTPTLSPVRKEATSPPSSIPTYWYTYSPTQTLTIAVKKPSNAEKDTQKPADRIETSEPTVRRETQIPSTKVHTQKPVMPKPVPQEKWQKPTARPSAQSDTSTPTIQKDVSKKKKFFCAASAKDLESSCDSSPECDLTRPCPAGLGCIQFDGCKDTSQKPPNSGAVWNIFPDLCPLGFVGLRAPAGDCGQYYDCRDGFLQASFLCESGFMFENGRGECISQKLVNSKCEISESGVSIGEIQEPDLTLISGNEENMDIISVEAMPQSDPMHTPDVCPPGLIGLFAKDDCTGYYECKEGYLAAVHECDQGFRFDNINGGCMSQELIDDNCEALHHETNKDQNPAPGSGKEDNSSLQLGSASAGGKAEDNNNNGKDQTNKMEFGKENADAVSQSNGLTETGESYSGNHQPGNSPTPDNFSIDLCPSGFIGFHVKTDCSKYYECNDGVMSGPVHTCTTSYKFDKVRGHCIPGELVSEFCYGPALETEVDGGQYSTTHMPLPAPALEGAPTASPDGQVGARGAALASSNTASPTLPMSESSWLHSTPPTKKKYTLWLRNYDNSGGRAPRLGDINGVFVVIPILFLILQIH